MWEIEVDPDRETAPSVSPISVPAPIALGATVTDRSCLLSPQAPELSFWGGMLTDMAALQVRRATNAPNRTFPRHGFNRRRELWIRIESQGLLTKLREQLRKPSEK
jgi:hypothetical protein